MGACSASAVLGSDKAALPAQHRGHATAPQRPVPAPPPSLAVPPLQEPLEIRAEDSLA